MPRIENVRFPDHFRINLVDKSLNYVQSPNDILIVSYPKCGAHWLCHILGLILTDFADSVPSAVFLEAAGDDGSESTDERIVFTHLPAKLFKRNAKIRKVIYLCRHPADIVISYHNHCSKLVSFYSEGDKCLDDFVDAFLDGDCCYGDYFDHVNDWLSFRCDDIYVVTYEQLQFNFEPTIEGLLAFIGRGDYLQNDRKAKVAKLAEATTVVKTKQEIIRQLQAVVNTPGNLLHLNAVQCAEVQSLQKTEAQEAYASVFARNGRIGEGRHRLDDQQFNRIEAMIRGRLAGTVIFKEWQRMGLTS